MSNDPKSKDLCTGCGHSLAWHFRDVTDTVRCMIIRTGVSDSGVCGIPWSERCACTAFVLPKPPEHTDNQTKTERAATRKLLRDALDKIK